MSSSRCWPTLLELATAELLALWALRRRAEGGEAVAEVQQGLFIAVGVSGIEAALGGFDAMLMALARHGRRRLLIHRPRCSTLSADEQAMLTLLAAHQARRAAHVAALVRWLVRDPGTPQLGAASRRFADALQARRLMLPLRVATAAPAASTNMQLTVIRTSAMLVCSPTHG